MKNALKSRPVEGQAAEDQDCPPMHEPGWYAFVADTKREWKNPAPGRIKRFARYVYDRFVRLHGSPEQIAWGVACGFFVAMTPTMGFQMAIAIPLAAFFRISKLAAAISVWLTNPATAPFLYWLNYKVGAKVLGYSVNARFLAAPSWETFWSSGTHAVLSLTVGGAITGLIVGTIGYFVTLVMVRAARKKVHLRLARKKET
jgi:uncharacterized protein (DUF2062 family)